MNDTETAREALLAEVIGVAANLIRQVDSLVPALNSACAAVAQACDRLQDGVTATEERMRTASDVAKTLLVNHVARRADDLARNAMEAQMQAMEATIRQLLQRELAPELQRLATTTGQASRLNLWWTHVATAVFSATASGVATACWLAQ